MRIKEIVLNRYGPLRQIDLDIKPGIQSLYGPNESGKTLMIDALVKILTGGSTDLPGSLDRVAEGPDGYVVLEQEGRELKINGDQPLTDFLNVTPGELMNIFVVRDSDLRITKEDEFFERVTDKMTGLKVEDIRRVKKAIREHGRLTPSGKLSNSEANNYAESVLHEAKELESDIKNYMEQAQKEDVEGLEGQIIEAKSAKEDLVETLAKLEKASKKEEFENLQASYGSAYTVLLELDRMPAELETLKNRIASLEPRSARIEDLKRREQLYRKLSYILPGSSAAAFIIAALLGALNPAGLLIPVGLMLLFLLMLILRSSTSGELSSIERERKHLITDAAASGINARDLIGLRSALARAERQRKELTAKLNQHLGVLKDRMWVKEEDPKNALETCSQKLEQMKREADLDIDMKYDQETEKQAREKVKELKEEIKELTTSYSGHKDKIEGFLERARNLDFKTFLGQDLEVEGKNLETLIQVKIMVIRLTGRIKRQAELSRKSMEIFDELDSEEKSKVEDLFGEDSSVSAIFTELTDKRYTKVEYDTQSKNILVYRDSGRHLDLEKLSKGTRDQLYLAIRVALGRRLLEGKPGFFIMDDAFLSSDSHRQRLEFEMLQTLSEKGWQVIYSTAKEHVTGGLEKISGNETLHFATLS